jgi:sugar-phosphatase
MLFDLDGVLVDSRECIERVWRAWAAARGRDHRDFLRVAHGRRTSETVRLVAPELDAGAESAVLDAMEAVEASGLVAFPGAHELLAAIPSGRWAVVTSGSLPVATLRLGTAGIVPPAVFITAGDVRKGKPDPEGYLAAAGRLGLCPSDCIVVEDSPTGVAAGKAAGMRVVAVATTYPPDALAAADVRLPALAALRVRPGDDGTMELTFAVAGLVLGEAVNGG